jgi:Flp pilus assembly protein TadG
MGDGGRGALHRDDLGQSLVEIALSLPMLVFVLIGGADLARAYAMQLAVQNGARAGAEAYAISQSPSIAQATQRAVDEINRTPGLSAGAANVTVSPNLTAAGTACTPPPTVLLPCYVTVRVRYTFQTVIPWPFIPNSANFDRSTTVRQFN